MVSRQFNGLAAEGREQTWVELVGTAFWLLWVAPEMVEEETVHWFCGEAGDRHRERCVDWWQGFSCSLAGKNQKLNLAESRLDEPKE